MAAPKRGSPGYDAYRDYMRDYMKRRYHERRSEMIDELGAACSLCGGTWRLEIDHVDAAEKVLQTNRMTMVGRERMKEELQKCQLLCRSCHITKTRESGDQAKGRKRNLAPLR